jgi:Protein of unknown function (DUF1592)/Protein of unknown function (DUF1588)/Protein of unknown function (DUF1595)/Protein of unknown function (DUF1585)/Protein of unknown function (DUF1587)
MRNDRVKRRAHQACLLGPLALLSACYSGLGENGSAGGDDDSAGTVATDGAGTDDTGGSTGDGPVAGCEAPSAGVTELRRLTAVQYENSVRDLLGYSGEATLGFSPDERVGPFLSNVGAPVSEVQVEQYMDAAEEIATWSIENVAALLPCDPSVVGEDECATAFIAEFAPRAYRRPLDAAELTRLQQVYADGKAEADFANGIRLVVQAALQSPWFLYHMEFGAAGTNDGELVALTDHELAARLSYFVWNSMPDDTLFTAAGAGELATTQGLQAQVDRMLADPRARDTIAAFHLQWLGVDAIDSLEKNPDTFPGFTPALALAMRAETAAFATHIVLDGDGLFDTLLTADFTLTEDPDLLALYGVTLPPGHVAGDPVPLPADRRMGLLTQASVLARHAHVNQTSPVHRGRLVRENLLCQPLPAPPPDVDNVPPTPDPDATTRERFEQHRADPSCAGCHSLIDPIGFTFEHYDGMGAWRDLEAGKAVDASGELISTDVDGPIDGVLELANKLAQSDDVKRCVTRQWFRFATGRNEAPEDVCTNDALDTTFVESGGDIHVLIRDLVSSDSFRHRRAAVSANTESPEGDR